MNPCFPVHSTLHDFTQWVMKFLRGLSVERCTEVSRNRTALDTGRQSERLRDSRRDVGI